MLKDFNYIYFKKSKLKKLMILIIFFILIFYLNINLVFAQRIKKNILPEDNILYSNYINLDLLIKNNFYLSSTAEDLKIYLEFFPEDSFNQKVLSIDTDPDSKNINYAYLFHFNDLYKGDYSIILKAYLKNNFQFNNVTKKIDFPIDKEKIPKDALIYLQPTKKIDVNDKIKDKANEIVYGDDDLFSVVFKLASWVNSNINYSLTTKTAEASQPSSWVLDNGYGVCDELTNLFISFCRSLGIPARFVSGISYTNSDLFDENWGMHGWAEVYFPEYGWIPFDTTYGQYGYLDAGHIKLKDSLDSDKSSVKYEWKSKDAELKSKGISFDVNLIEKSDLIENPVSLNLIPYYEKVSFGSYNLIELELKNNLDKYIGFEVYLNTPKEIKLIDDKNIELKNKKKYVLLSPFEKKSVFWVVKTEDNLLKNYIYFFPLRVTNNFNYSVDAIYNSSYDYKYYDFEEILKLKESLEQEKEVLKKDLYTKCDYTFNIYANESNEVICYFENKGNIYFKKLRACIKNCVYFDLGISEQKNITFNISFKDIGKKNFTLLVGNNDISLVKNYNVFVEDIPKITIEKIQIPDELEYEDFEVSFEIWKHSISKPKNVTIIFRFNDYEEKVFFDEIDGNKVLRFNVDKKIIDFLNNKNYAAINLTYYEHLNYSEMFLIKKEIKIKEYDIINKIIILISKLFFNLFKNL